VSGAAVKGQRLNERPHQLPGEFLAELGQFAEQMDQAALFGAVQAVSAAQKVAAKLPLQQGLGGPRGDELLHGVSVQLLVAGADAADQGRGWP
jgi:hypothetical protein